MHRRPDLPPNRNARGDLLQRDLSCFSRFRIVGFQHAAENADRRGGLLITVAASHVRQRFDGIIARVVELLCGILAIGKAVAVELADPARNVGRRRGRTAHRFAIVRPSRRQRRSKCGHADKRNRDDQNPIQSCAPRGDHHRNAPRVLLPSAVMKPRAKAFGTLVHQHTPFTANCPCNGGHRRLTPLPLTSSATA